MRLKKILLSIFIFFSCNIQSQIIKDWINSNEIGFVPKSEIDYVLLKFSGEGKSYVTKLKYNENLKVISKENIENNNLAFKITKEYDSLYRIKKEKKLVKSFNGTIESFKTFSWKDSTLEVLEYDKINNIKITSIIEVDSLLNPLNIVSFDTNKNMIGREQAKYDYKNNICEIYIYNHQEKLVGITIINIFDRNVKISFEDYVKKTNYEELKYLCKNWQEFEIVIFDRKFKFDKENNWKSRTFEKLYYSPNTKKFRRNFNDITTRKIVYKK